MPLPVLARYEESVIRIKQLQDENDMLKQRLVVMQQKDDRTAPVGPEAPPTPQIMDDFYSIAQYVILCLLLLWIIFIGKVCIQIDQKYCFNLKI